MAGSEPSMAMIEELSSGRVELGAGRTAYLVPRNRGEQAEWLERVDASDVLPFVGRDDDPAVVVCAALAVETTSQQVWQVIRAKEVRVIPAPELATMCKQAASAYPFDFSVEPILTTAVGPRASAVGPLLAEIVPIADAQTPGALRCFFQGDAQAYAAELAQRLLGH